MAYNWEGDLILQDCAIEKKRYVIATRQPITTDIREWISFEDNIIMKEILAELRDRHGLPRSKKPGDFDRRAMVIWRLIARKITYVHDTTKYKKDDFWLFPPETWQIKKGDCEDGSFLLASLLIASGISPFCVRVVLGRAFDRSGKPLGGHCWPVYKNEAGIWCILESTLDTVPARMPAAEELAGEGQVFRYEPLYCFNGHHLWAISPPESAAAGQGTLDKYFRARRKRADMAKARELLFRRHRTAILAQRRRDAKKG
jgi:hypothetical protein